MPSAVDSHFLSGCDPVFPVPLILSLAALAAGLTLFRAFRGRPLHPGWVRAPVVIFRLVTIAGLTFILLNPSQTVSLPQNHSRSAVLLDGSASMALGAPGGPTRWREAADWTTQYQAALA